MASIEVGFDARNSSPGFPSELELGPYNCKRGLMQMVFLILVCGRS
jgi:hypothetical protein